MVTAVPIHETSSAARPGVEQIWAWLREVLDPEIPVVSVVDLGMVRNVAWSEDGDTCIVTITPTYSGCPAATVIQSLIREELNRHGIARLDLRVQLSPPWTTGWLSANARESLRAFGIAPPDGRSSAPSASVLPVLASAGPQPAPHCPRCRSTRTVPISQFGSTLCKALYRCEDCLEPFDYFKRH